MKYLCAIFLTAMAAFSQTVGYSTGQAARLVIGQQFFDSGSPTASPSSTIMGAPSGVAYANNMLFVVDSNQVGATPVNNRVLIYGNLTGQLPSPTANLVYNKVCPVCVGQANVVIGQPDFSSFFPTPCPVPPPNSGTPTIPTWTASTAYAYATEIVDPSNHFQEATTAGTSGTTQPTWNDTGGTTSDGTVIWTDEGLDTAICPTNSPQIPSSTGMRAPTGVASDGTHLVVADTLNNRVLIWNSIPTSNGQPADVVVGQTDFTTSTFPNTPTAASLRGPQGVWLQGGKLYIADTLNNRVIIFNSIPTGNGASADLVLGQPNLTTYVPTDIANLNASAAANNMYNPVSVTSDGVKLYVTDLGFNRVLIWNTIPTANQVAADVVVGQPNMTSANYNNSFSSVTTNSTTTNTPVLCQEATGLPTWTPNTAYVAGIQVVDAGGHFQQVTTAGTSGGSLPAWNDLGSTTNDGSVVWTDEGVDSAAFPSLCAATLSVPRFALSDGTRLYIADGGNDRILVFNTIPTANGASADAVLGQPSNQIDTAANGADGMSTPMALATDGQNLYVADCYNERIVVYTLAELDLAATAVRNAASLNIYAGGTVTFGATIKAKDTVTLTIQNKAYTYTIQSSDTLPTVVEAMTALINAGSGDPNVLATADEVIDEIILTSRVPGADGNNITLAATVSSNAQITATPSGSTLAGGSSAANVAAGTLVSILGSNLSSGTAAPPPGSPVLPTNLGGVQVFMNGVAAPLMYVSPTQINSQIPYSAVLTGTLSVYVRKTDASGTVTVTNPEAVFVVPAAPGIFTQSGNFNNPRPAVALHGSNYAVGVVSVDGTIAAGDTGTITINGRSYTYKVQASDTLASIEAAFIGLINADPQVQAFAANQFTRIILQARVTGTAGDGIPYNATVVGAVSGQPKLELTPIGPEGPNATGAALCCANVAGSMLSNQSPALPGEIITIYATGLGLPVLTSAVQPFLVTGHTYLGSPNNTPKNSVTALTDGKTGQILSASLVPGMVGVYQLQVQLGSSVVSDPETQLTISQNLFVSNIVTIPVSSAQLTAMTCSPTSLNSGKSATCTVTINQAADGAGATILLSDNNTLLTVPASVTVSPGSTSATFTITAGTITSSASAIVGASLNTTTESVSITLEP